MSGHPEEKAVFVYSKRLGEYSFTPDHPFKPERVERVYRMCGQRGLLSAPGVRVLELEEPEEGVLERYHSSEYIDILRKANSGDSVDVEMLHHGIGTMENPVFRGIFDFSCLAATASLEAARAVASGRCSAFNPCGGFHHAHRDRASGFCYVNDIAIAMGELRERGIRTAYVDIDAHHGDAVQEAFYDDPGVLTISIHESGRTLFPWGGFERETGEGSGKGFNINVPLEPNTDDEIFLFLFRRIAIDALSRFSPEVVVGQFGTDTFAADPLTHLRLTNNGYIEAITELHERFPRILALGGGGYSMDDSVRGWTIMWAELAGVELDEGYGGAMGGVFLGDSSIEGSDLRDMRAFTTGPEKEALVEKAEATVGWYEREIREGLSRG